MKHLLLALAAVVAVTPAFAAPVVTDMVIEGSQRPIPTTITLPEGDGPFPFVVLYHGTGSNRHEAGNGYDLLAPALAEAGIASARFDFAGNGDSTVDYAEYTFSSGITDGLDVIAHMRELPQIDDARLGVAGWSQGGTIAMLTAARYPDDVQSLVTWAGALDMSGFAPELYEEASKNGTAQLTFDWREPLNISKAWFDEARSTDVAAELANYDDATLAIAGSNDTVVLPEVAQAILDATGGEPAEVAIIEGADHTFNIFSGDMSAFNELIEKTVSWFEATL
ncbi:MAG TPA: alpha/beta hydrolase [Devosia sp.]|nr:alpha/beta hydrolase [Devosia sp.]